MVEELDWVGRVNECSWLVGTIKEVLERECGGSLIGWSKERRPTEKT
jgi:hypothetical protein